MTVQSLIPIERYTGDGALTAFQWQWDMIADSTINVLVDNTVADNWVLQGNTVVFDTPPDAGAEVIIYRRTKIWMPEDYIAYGRFPANKTELSVDRAIIIAQEVAGDRGIGQTGGGIVGGANLFTKVNEFDIDLISERGEDAVIPHWSPDDIVPPTAPPDATIIWGGADIQAGIYSLSGNVNGVTCQLGFRLDAVNGVVGEGDAYYNSNNDFVFVSWVDHDPADNDYWMRVTGQVNISDGENFRASGEPFPIRGQTINPIFGPVISINTFGDTAPITRTADCTVEICKDLSGVPDGNWVSRNVKLTAIFNLEGEYVPPPQTTPPPGDPVDVTGAIAWGDFFFGRVFDDPISDDTQVIPDAGQSIWFTVPASEVRPIRVLFSNIEVFSVPTIRTGAVNTTVGDYITPPTFSWGNGGGINGGINQPGVYDIDLIPGNTYILNMRNETPGNPNWTRIQVNYIDET